MYILEGRYKEMLFFLAEVSLHNLFAALGEQLFFDLIGLVNRFDHSVLIHSFMSSSSHHAFSWNVSFNSLP